MSLSRYYITKYNTPQTKSSFLLCFYLPFNQKPILSPLSISSEGYTFALTNISLFLECSPQLAKLQSLFFKSYEYQLISLQYHQWSSLLNQSVA